MKEDMDKFDTGDEASPTFRQFRFHKQALNLTK